MDYVKAKNICYRHNMPVSNDKQITAWNGVWIIADLDAIPDHTKHVYSFNGMTEHICRHLPTLMSSAADLQHKLENILIQLLFLQCFPSFLRLSKNMPHLASVTGMELSIF